MAACLVQPLKPIEMKGQSEMDEQIAIETFSSCRSHHPLRSSR